MNIIGDSTRGARGHMPPSSSCYSIENYCAPQLWKTSCTLEYSFIFIIAENLGFAIMIYMLLTWPNQRCELDWLLLEQSCI